MAATFGIHVGNTTSSLAISRDGKVDVVANDAGDRVTPAMVSFQDSEQVVGLPAKQGLARNLANTLYYCKCLLQAGCSEAEVNKIMHNITCKISLTETGSVYEVNSNGKKQLVTPQAVIKMIYRKMLDVADSQQGLSSSHDCVITVPLNFSKEQIQIMRDAATAAGCKVLRVIPEPAAALLAYGIGQDVSHGTFYCLVYRIGGKTMDVTLLRCCEGLYSVVTTEYRDSLGGEQCTDLLVEYFAEEFRKYFKANVKENNRSLMKLRSAAENCKHILTTLGTSQCFVESLHDGMDFTANITRARFESLVSSIQSQYLEPVKQVLESAQLQGADINKVVLVGGATKMPKIQQLVSDMFTQAEIFTSIPQDEVIAFGAAVEASLLNEDKVCSDFDQSVIVNVLSKGLYIKVVDSEQTTSLHCVIPEGTAVPVLRHHRVKMAPEQDGVCVEVYEANQGDLAAATLIAKLVLKEATKGGEIQVTLEMTRESSLRASVSDRSTGAVEHVVVEVSATS